MGVFLAGLCAGAALGAGAAAWRAGREQRRLSRFLSYAAHELTTPVTAVNMTILNILHGAFGKPPPEQAPWLEMMREQVARLGGLIGELRDFADLSRGAGLRLHLEEVPPADLLEAALKLVRHGCQQAGVGVEVSLEKRLPRVEADSDRLARSWGSLLLHARKFRAAGDLEVGLKGQGRAVVFTVRYAGPRLSPEEAGEALGLFYPAGDRRAAPLSSTGLGLGVARAVARCHGGDLSFEVEPSGASLLRLWVPAGRA